MLVGKFMSPHPVEFNDFSIKTQHMLRIIDLNKKIPKRKFLFNKKIYYSQKIQSFDV